jgi:cytochrome bd ubiquinol oxidase subunit I
MEDALLVSRTQFAFTITYHYLFPQLTMGLALIIVIFKWLGRKTGEQHYNRAAQFWGKIFGVNFVMGVVTGIPMEFQFGTNWAEFSTFAGGVIGQTLAMEGMFAFFLESSFLGIFLYGERKFGPRIHFLSAVLVFLGSWLSGYFIVCTNAWMQHPVGYELSASGEVQLTSFWALLLNPWAISQYAHTMVGSVITASFVVTSVGAYYKLVGRDTNYASLFLRTGVTMGLIASVLALFPTGDLEGRNVAIHQPEKLAAMEGLFESQEGAELILIGQPDMVKRRLDNPIAIPNLLSFLTYMRWNAEIKGLEAFPEEDWPTNVPLTYFAYHIMVGLGTLFILVMGAAFVLERKGRLGDSRWMLWILMLAFPFPYIANIAGWMTAELGRQPWLVYKLLRTSEGVSQVVSAGNALFSLLGFMGMYTILSVLFLFLIAREVTLGPDVTSHGSEPSPIPVR